MSVLSDLREEAKQLSSSDPKETVGLNKNHKREEAKGESAVRDVQAAQLSVEGSDDGSNGNEGSSTDSTDSDIIESKPSPSSRLLNRARRAKPTPLSLEEVMAIGRQVEERQREAFRSPITPTSSASMSTSASTPSTSSSSSRTASSPPVDIAAAAQAAMGVYEDYSDDTPQGDFVLFVCLLLQSLTSVLLSYCYDFRCCSP